MKKILSIIIASMFLSLTASAEGLVGIKYGYGELESTASQTGDVNQTKAVDNAYGAVFAEYSLGEFGPMSTPFSVGIEYIPFTATVDIDGQSKTDSHLELSDHTTLYVLASKELENGASVYGKLGYAMADISNVKANYDNITTSSPDDTLEGPMIGLGLQSSMFSKFGLISRIEATHTMYDDVSVKRTDSDDSSTETKTATDTTLTTISFSIAKQF